jgi:hypothetical protein
VQVGQKRNLQLVQVSAAAGQPNVDPRDQQAAAQMLAREATEPGRV